MSAPFLLAAECTCPDCTRSARRVPSDPPQLAIPVPLYPASYREPALPLLPKELPA